jgi:hypothetical protein
MRQYLNPVQHQIHRMNSWLWFALVLMTLRRLISDVWQWKPHWVTSTASVDRWQEQFRCTGTTIPRIGSWLMALSDKTSTEIERGREHLHPLMSFIVLTPAKLLSKDLWTISKLELLTFFSLPTLGRELCYGLDDRGSRVRFPVGAGNFSFHHRVQNGSGAHPASYPMGTGFFPGSKAAGAWSWPITSI